MINLIVINIRIKVNNFRGMLLTGGGCRHKKQYTSCSVLHPGHVKWVNVYVNFSNFCVCVNSKV